MQTVVRVLCGLLGIAIAALALIVTIEFYSSYGTSDGTQRTFIALAIVSMAIKLLAPAAAASVRGFRLVQAALWIGFGAAVIFDSFGVAGYVEMTYGSKSGEATRYADDYKKASATVTKLEADYQAYAATRPTGVIDSELSAAEALAGTCTKRRAHLDVCVKVSDLKTELASADERDKREANWRKAKTEFDAMKKPAVTADPQAAVISRIGSRIGADWLADFVAPIISILIFIFFEVVGPAAMFAALHGQAGAKPNSNRVDAASTPAKGARSRRTNGAPTTSDGVLTAFRALLAGSMSYPGVTATGNRIVCPQRTLGKALGISGSKVNQHLKALRDAGTISTRTVPEGTEIIVLGV